MKAQKTNFTNSLTLEDIFCELIGSDQERKELQKESINLPSYTLTTRQLCDIEMLLNGGFSPLKGFLTKTDYTAVLDSMRLSSGRLWPMPITLDMQEKTASQYSIGNKIALRDPEGILLAVMEVSDFWKPNRQEEAWKVFGTTDQAHPAVNYLYNISGDTYLGGIIRGVELPSHYDFKSLRLSPQQLKAEFKRKGWDKIIAFQTRNPMHRAHYELTKRGAEQTGCKLLIQPVVGMTKPGDIDHYVRVRCYNKLLKRYPKDSVALNLLPLAMRMGGPREALWHALIRKNYGCTHFIVGRDHAGPGKDSLGKEFYGPYDAQELVKRHSDEIGIQVACFKDMVYVEEEKVYKPFDEIKKDQTILNISGTQQRQKLDNGETIPEWFTFPEIAEELSKSKPPKLKRGFTVFFSGLSGSGKSTICNALQSRLMELDDRPLTVLDGDIVRTHLSSELNFSKEHRSLNIRRIGYVASQITKCHGIALCAPIAPYESDRKANRDLISNLGGYIEVFVSTPIEICEARDRKGLYAKARKGIVKGFTGIDDPYEQPQNPELILDTSKLSVSDCVEQIITYLRNSGYLHKVD